LLSFFFIFRFLLLYLVSFPCFRHTHSFLCCPSFSLQSFLSLSQYRLVSISLSTIFIGCLALHYIPLLCIASLTIDYSFFHHEGRFSGLAPFRPGHGSGYRSGMFPFSMEYKRTILMFYTVVG
jgi:hypothetical protein